MLSKDQQNTFPHYFLRKVMVAISLLDQKAKMLNN